MNAYHRRPILALSLLVAGTWGCQTRGGCTGRGAATDRGEVNSTSAPTAKKPQPTAPTKPKAVEGPGVHGGPRAVEGRGDEASGPLCQTGNQRRCVRRLIKLLSSYLASGDRAVFKEFNAWVGEENRVPRVDEEQRFKQEMLVVLGLFMGVGYMADKWARSATSPGMQYLGLGLYVVAEAIIFLPMLYIAAFMVEAPVIKPAALLTLTLFAGLTGTVFITRKDFSFLRTGLMLGGFVALGLIVASILFGFNLGTIFSVAMVGLAGGYILYYTSNVLHHYRTDQHVAASLALFAAVALMFWYILRLFMNRD